MGLIIIFKRFLFLFITSYDKNPSADSEKFVKVLRVLRVLRPLKAINKAKKLKVSVQMSFNCFLH